MTIDYNSMHCIIFQKLYVRSIDSFKDITDAKLFCLIFKPLQILLN